MFPNRVSQLPFTTFLLPEVWRAEFVAELHEVIRLHADVVHHFMEELGGELAIEALHQGNRVFASQVLVANFLGPLGE